MYSILNEYGRPGRRYSGLGEKKVYTGLQYKDVYVIISPVEGQIYNEAQKHEMSSTDDIRWRNDIYHIFKNN